MIRKFVAVVLLSGFSWSASEAFAQNGLQELQKKVDDALPKGRLLKRLRDEIRGTADEQAKKEQEKQKEKELQQRQQTQQREAQQRELQQREMQQRQSRNPNYRGPTPADPNTRFQSNNPNGNGIVDPRGQASENFAQLTDEDRPRGNRKVDSADQPVGFGMVIDVRDDQVLVVEVDRKGNAHAAGLRPGDVLEKVGGVPLKTINEFDEVVGVLKNGDQIDVEYSRKGKSQSAALTFGHLDPDALAASTASRPEFDQAPAELPSSAKSAPNPNREFTDFAPPIFSSSNANSDPGLRSVLENNNPSSPLPSPSMKVTSQERLEQIIAEQQRTIETLQKELEQLRKNSSRTKSIDPPLGI